MLSAHRSFRFWLGIVVVAICSFSYVRIYAQTTPPSPWLSTSVPTIEKISDVDTSSAYPQSYISNRDCTEREIVTRSRFYTLPPQNKTYNQSCVADTAYGSMTSSGFLQRVDSSIYGQVTTNSGGTAVMLPAPKSGTGIRLGTSGGYGSYLFFYDDLASSLSSVEFLGEVTHKLPSSYSAMLKDKAGNLLAIDSGSVSFSANGDWMVADIPFMAMARINVKTREVIPFGNATNYNIGVGAGHKTAISPNGRYAAVYSKNFDIFRLYDLSTCGEVPTIISRGVSCSYVNLMPFVKQNLAGFTSIASMRLNDDFTLDAYANYTVGNSTKIGRYVIVAPGQKASLGFQYLALGDSFASGEGAYSYKAFTDTTDNKCHLSYKSYPYLIGSSLGYSKYESVACSGAKMDHVDNLKEAQDKPQAKGKKDPLFDEEIYSGYLAGYRAQTLFALKEKPAVITLSASGNDIGFADKIKRCLDTDTCYNSYEDRVEIVQEINNQFDRIVSMYNEVKTSADPSTKIYVIGYPQIVYPDGVCDMNVHLSHDELVFAQKLTTYFNSVIKKATEKAGVYYVDMEEALDGHRLCERINSWDIAVNGLTAGDDTLLNVGPIANESYHPNTLGHYLMSQAILRLTENFTKPMPTPKPGITVGYPSSSEPLLQAPKSNRTVRSIRHFTGVEGGAVQTGGNLFMKATDLDLIFAAKSKVQAWIHSTPTNLGTYTLDASGDITIDTVLPGSVQPGIHTLHFYGKNSSGEDIDAYQAVYVSGVSFCTANIDSDKDDIDDACDGFIDKPPVVVQPTPQPSQIGRDYVPLPPTTLVEGEADQLASLTSTPQQAEVLALTISNDSLTTSPQQELDISSYAPAHVLAASDLGSSNKLSTTPVRAVDAARAAGTSFHFPAITIALSLVVLVIVLTLFFVL